MKSPSKAGNVCSQCLCLPKATDVPPLFRFMEWKHFTCCLNLSTQRRDGAEEVVCSRGACVYHNVCGSRQYSTSTQTQMRETKKKKRKLGAKLSFLLTVHLNILLAQTEPCDFVHVSKMIRLAWVLCFYSRHISPGKLETDNVSTSVNTLTPWVPWEL